MEYYSKKAESKPIAVHQVLANLYELLDERYDIENDEDGPTTDRQIFESFLAEDVGSSRTGETGDDSSNEETNKVFIINESWALPSGGPFHGACLESAAQKTVIGKEQAEAYCDFANIPFAPKPASNPTYYSFGTHRHKGLGYIEIRVPITEIHFLLLIVEFVTVNVPFLLGLDEMTKYKMVLDTDE